MLFLKRSMTVVFLSSCAKSQDPSLAGRIWMLFLKRSMTWQPMIVSEHA